MTHFSNVKCVPFASVFAGLLSSTSSICGKSYVKVHKEMEDLEAYDLPLVLFIINVGLASSNKSCCTDLFRGFVFFS